MASALKVALFYLSADKSEDFLYVVHPDAVLEQTQYYIKYVKTFIDKIRSKIKEFSGKIIVALLDKSAYEASGEAYEYVSEFLKEIRGNSKIIIVTEQRNKDNPLGKEATKHIDDLYLEGKLGKIILIGAFTCDYTDMCVDATYKSLVAEYGEEHVTRDFSAILKAGPVHPDNKS